MPASPPPRGRRPVSPLPGLRRPSDTRSAVDGRLVGRDRPVQAPSPKRCGAGLGRMACRGPFAWPVARGRSRAMRTRGGRAGRRARFDARVARPRASAPERRNGRRRDHRITSAPEALASRSEVGSRSHRDGRPRPPGATHGAGEERRDPAACADRERRASDVLVLPVSRRAGTWAQQPHRTHDDSLPSLRQQALPSRDRPSLRVHRLQRAGPVRQQLRRAVPRECGASGA